MEQRHGTPQGWALFNSVSGWWTTSPTTVPRKAPLTLVAPERPAILTRRLRFHPLARIVTDGDGRFAGLSNTEAGQARLRQQLAASGYGHHSDFAPASNYWAVRIWTMPGALLNGPQFGFAMPSYVYGIGLHGGILTLWATPCWRCRRCCLPITTTSPGAASPASRTRPMNRLRLNDNPEQYWHDGEAGVR